jgi:hypothetical protein
MGCTEHSLINNNNNNIVAGQAVRNTTFTKLINISAHELAEILINLVKVMFGAPNQGRLIDMLGSERLNELRSWIT